MGTSAPPLLPNTANQPTKPGWHLLSFLDGSTAVVRWDGGAWKWGSLHPPTAPITSFTYLGSSISDISSAGGAKRWGNALAGLPSHVSTELIALIDHGILGLKGQPVLLSGPTGVPSGNSGQTGSEANPVNAIPSPIDPNVGNSHLSLPSLTGLFGSLSLWKGVGLVIAGAALLIFAAIEFKSMAR